MKNITLIALCFLMTNLMIGQKMMTKTGTIRFEASTPLESINSVNNTVSSILDQENGNFAVLSLIKAFRFKVPLMEEHFNENYMESSKYPKATFKGKIINFEASKLTSAKTTYDIEGDLTMHGVTKRVKTKIMLALNGEKISATGKFNVKPQDYDIQIPSIVRSKIAETVLVEYDFNLEPK